jgi:outer membrane protein assembly factor BamD (BamD/ComL family)
MCRLNTFIAVVVLLISLSASAQEALDESAARALKAYQLAGSAEMGIKVLKEFLSTYPESSYTQNYLSRIIRLLVNDLDDRSGAIQYTKEIIGKLNDKQIKADILYSLAELYGSPAYKEDLAATVREISALGEIRYLPY